MKEMGEGDHAKIYPCSCKDKLIHKEKPKGRGFTTTNEDQDHIRESLSSSHEEGEEEENVPYFKKIERKKQQRVT